jgi:uncharacterized protein (AIM24 family)
VHQSGFVCGVPGVQVSVGFQKNVGAGLFGDAGFIMQKIAGQGVAFVQTYGELVAYELAAGMSMRVHPGHVAMFQESVQIELTSVPGIKNKLFGDGLFLAQLTGPGRVWLQSLTLPNLAHAIEAYLPKPEEAT